MDNKMMVNRNINSKFDSILNRELSSISKIMISMINIAIDTNQHNGIINVYIDISPNNDTIYNSNIYLLNPREYGIIDAEDIRKKSVKRLKIKDDSVDLITFNSNLNYFRNPCMVISDISKMIKQGGLLFIRGNNVSGKHKNDIVRYLDFINIVINREIPDANYSIYRRYWSYGGLKRLLECNGFQLLTMQTFPTMENPQRTYHALFKYIGYKKLGLTNMEKDLKCYDISKSAIINWINEKHKELMMVNINNYKNNEKKGVYANNNSKLKAPHEFYYLWVKSTIKIVYNIEYREFNKIVWCSNSDYEFFKLLYREVKKFNNSGNYRISDENKFTTSKIKGYSHVNDSQYYSNCNVQLNNSIINIDENREMLKNADNFSKT